MRKPFTAAEYDPEFTRLVKSTCLYVATRIGDLIDDTVIVGGLVPSLIVDQPENMTADARHVGTRDLDVGLALAVLSEGRYEELAERLREASFEPDTNAAGNVTRQRWKIEGPPKITVDFLIPPSLATDEGGDIRNIEPDFAAIIAPALKLAFIDRQKVKLQGKTIRNEKATREVWVAGPAAFVAMKALAFHRRGAEKDAYDLWYVLLRFGAGLHDVVEKMSPMLQEPEVGEALAYLRDDFSEIDSLGPKRVAAFLGKSNDAEFLADVRGLVLAFAEACAK
jgi:hypothetical protein